MTAAQRAADLARDIAEHTDPAGCPECAGLNRLAGYFVALARQGIAADFCEYALSATLRDLGVEETR